MTAIQTRNVSKHFGETVAVENLDLEVAEGEVFGFLGRNGAGKSTTINMLLDFVRPTSGSIAVFGESPRENQRAVRDRIGVLPEGYDLYGRLTARKHVAFAAEMKGHDDDPDEILERVGLADAATKQAGGFSKGMRQRLAFGMALVGEPDLLILDEPSSGLDPSGAQHLREIVQTECERGATVFFSSHILEHVEAVCDRVGIMRDGELAAVDTVDGLRKSAETDATLVLTVDHVQGVDRLREIDGVTGIDVTDSTLRINYSNSLAKARIITQIEDAGTSVLDIDVEERSLGDLFGEYTTPGISGGKR